MSTGKTTKDKIKEMFLKGDILTSCGAAKDFITADLRKYITTLKREGLDIIDEWVESKEGKRYKEYRLRKERGQDSQKEEIIPVPPIEPAAVMPDPSPIDLPELPIQSTSNTQPQLALFS